MRLRVVRSTTMGNAKASNRGTSNRYRFSRFFIILKPEFGEFIGHDRNIMEENNHEELQTRRSFFKNAAQKAMPFVALTALGGILSSCDKDEPDSPSGCGKTCSGSCDGDCAGDCDDGCWTACISACVKFQR